MIFEHEGIKLQMGFEPLQAVSLKEGRKQGAVYSTLAGDFELSFYAPGIIRLKRLLAKSPPDYGILAQESIPVQVNSSELQDGYRIQSGETAIELRSGPFRLHLLHEDKLLLQGATDRGIDGQIRFPPISRRADSWLLAFSLNSGEPVYGLGEKWGALNRRGQLITSWNEDATTVNSELSYKNVPFAWSPEGWGLFVNTPSRVTHGVGYAQWSHRSYILQIHDTDLDLFLIAASSPAQMLERYTLLTGRAPVPPRWSFGSWMSRAYYHTAETALAAAEKMYERKIPCDVLLLDGRAWHKMETRFDFQWDPDRYPDPGGFVKKLRNFGIRTNLWEYPYISTRNPLFNELAEKGYLLKKLNGEVYIHRWFPQPFDTILPHLMPSGILDFTNPEAYLWYRDMHKQLYEIGVSVMKTDYGEALPEDVVAFNGDSGKRLHNIYALLYNRCTYESAELYSQDGAAVWGRASWAGGQRFPIQWGGDPQSDWEGLAASIRGGLSWGMSGGAYYAHDIGGFAIGNPSPELYVRWMQAGVMSSHTRFHGLGEREPWVYGEEAETIVRSWLNWRYRLIPYLQGCALQAEQTGLPIARSMPLSFPEDRLSWQFDHQYMLGPALLAAPVIIPGGQVSFYLPQGRWFDLWNQTWVEGPGLFERGVPLDQIPVFGREGSILPLGPAVQHTGDLNPDLHVDEIWTFGEPTAGLPLPGLDLQVLPGEGLKNVPQDIRITQK